MINVEFGKEIHITGPTPIILCELEQVIRHVRKVLEESGKSEQFIKEKIALAGELGFLSEEESNRRAKEKLIDLIKEMMKEE